MSNYAIPSQAFELMLKERLGVSDEQDVYSWMVANGGLLVVTDFDGCLTPKYADGMVISMMNVVRSFLRVDYPRAFSHYQQILTAVRDIRSDSRLSPRQRASMVYDYWQEIMELLRTCPVISPEYLATIAKVRTIQIRPDMASWIKMLLEQGAQLVIYSASALGLNLIPQLLAAAGIEQNGHVHIISNGLAWNSAGLIKSIAQARLVTPINKEAAPILALLDHCPDHAIIIGDQLDDLRPVKGLPCAHKFTLGFASDREISTFMRHFDYVRMHALE